MDYLNMIYWLKQGFGSPDRYLGENVEKLQLKDGRVVLSTNFFYYLQSAIEFFDNSLGVDKTVLKNYVYGHRSYSSRFRPELYVTKELGQELTNSYQKLIGVLMWSIELGRIGVLMEISFLSQYFSSPIEGHLHYVYSILIYLQQNRGNNPGRMAYNPMYETTYENLLEVLGRNIYEWKYFYPYYQKMMPRYMPALLVNYVVIKDYLSANHVGNMSNTRSHYGIIIYVNNSPIIWYS